MKVAYVVGPFPAESKHLALIADSHDLVVYGSAKRMPGHSYQPEPPHGCQYRILDPVVLGRKGHLRWLYRGLNSALEADRPDIVHVISEPWGPLAVQAASWARRQRFGGLVLHGCDQLWNLKRGSLDPKRWPRVAAARFSLVRAGGFAGENSAAIHQAHHGGLKAGAPTGVVRTTPRDPALFSPPTDLERREARVRLGLPQEGIGFGLLGRFVPEKGSMLFLEAWSLARDQLSDSDTWAAIAGSGPLESELRRRADLDTSVLGSLGFPDEVADFYKAIDVFVHVPWQTPRWVEQGPRVVVEAMLSGCLIVVSKSGAIPEMIGDTGVLVPERDPAQLANAIAGSVKTLSERHRVREAQERALREFSVGATAQKLQDLWSRVIDTN